MMSAVRVGAVGAAGLALGLAGTPAHAEPSASDVAVAQGLFDNARSLIAEGHYTEACPKLAESLRLDPGLGTEYHLADCYEHVGKTASAWASFLRVASLAKASGQADREKVARTRALALEPHVPHVIITVAHGERAADLAIRRDGEPVGIAQLDTPLPLDPGPHVVVVTGQGHTFEKRFALAEDGGTLHLEIPALGGPLVARRQPNHPPSAPVEPESPPSPPGHTQRMLGVITTVVGVAGLGVGTFFGVRSMSKKSDADAACNADNVCTQAGADARNEARSAGNVSTVAFIAGGVLFTGGLVLYFTAPSASSGSDNASAVHLRVRPLGLAAEGTF